MTNIIKNVKIIKNAVDKVKLSPYSQVEILVKETSISFNYNMLSSILIGLDLIVIP